MIKHSKPNAEGVYTISGDNQILGTAERAGAGFQFRPLGAAEVQTYPTMAALKEALASRLRGDVDEDTIWGNFYALVERLSPENLGWGTNLPMEEVKKRNREIEREWFELETQLGRRVTRDEATDRAYRHWRETRTVQLQA